MNTLKNKFVWIGMAILMLVTLVLAVLAPNVRKLTMSQQERLMLTYPEFTDADYATQSENVRFLAYFAYDVDNDGVANKLSGTTRDVSGGDTLYLDFNVVSDGTLENGQITIGDSNFKLGMNQVKNSILARNYISDDVKSIQLKNMSAGTHGYLKCAISADLKNSINNFSKTTTITLTGTYVASNGTRTEINKSVNVTVDWFGTSRTQLQTYSSTDVIDYNNPRSTFTFSFVAAEKIGKLPIKATGAVVEVPTLGGVYPTEVKCENGTYNEETHTVTIRKQRGTLDDGTIINPIPSENKYTITVTYPDYVWDRIDFDNYIDTSVKLNFKVSAYYEVYNNENYTNPYRSYDTKNLVKVINIDRGEVPPEGYWNFDFADTEYRTREKDRVIDKQKLLDAYDNGDKEFYYTTYYEFKNARDGAVRFTNVEPDYIGTQDLWYSSTCYGVYVIGFEDALGEDGEIHIYNVVDNQAFPGVEMGEIEELAGFIRKHTTEGDILAFSGLQNAEDIEEYIANRQGGQGFSKDNPYIIGGDSLMPLNTAAKKITIETSELKADKYLGIYVIKKINMDMLRDTMSREELERASYMTTTVRLGLQVGGDKYTKSRTLIQDKSYATVGISNKNLVVGDPDEPVLNRTISINANKEQVGDALWKDGAFVVELPEEIVQMNINNVGIWGTNDISIKGYDLTKENGKYIVKIQTENANEASNINISINADMVVDPRVNSRDSYIRLFYYNPRCKANVSSTKDTYDVNENGSTEDYVGSAVQKVHFAAANTLITFQIASNYDDKGSVTVSPNIAEITKEARSADILLSITNNFDRSITNTKILGRVPYENNKYILTDRYIGSDFTANMKAGGIEVPDAIKENTKVYYSELETPTDDVTNSENGWVLAEAVTDWTKIKSYLIDLSAYTLDVGQNYDFTYSVTVPEGLDYNQTSYSTHAVIYDYNGNYGIEHFEDEPEKIGIKVSRLYDIDLTKFKEGFNLPVEGAAYQLTQKNSVGNVERENTLFSNVQGKMVAKNLYVNAEYELKELSAPSNYIKSDKVIKFKVVELEDKSLAVQVTSTDGFRNTPQMAVVDGKDVLQAELEDEPKYQLNVTYVDSKTGERIDNVFVRFAGLDTKMTINGEISYPRLLKDSSYTLEEIQIYGYEKENHTFKLKKVNGEYTLEASEKVNVISIVNNGETDLVQVNVEIQKEGNERYNFEIVKVEKDSSKTSLDEMKKLQGAKFNVQQVDNNEVSVFETDENGKITLNNLYQYEEGKVLTGKYIINEEEAPAGYVLNPETISFIAKTENGELELELENQASLTSFKGAIIEGNTIKMVLEDQPLFKLVKRDSNTGELLANAKFVIYELDDNSDIVDFAKDINDNYVGTLTNEKYLVETDENGVISLPLKNGKYQIEEIEAPKGYTGELIETFIVENEATVATTIVETTEDDSADYVIEEKANTLEINYIEDLLDLGNAVLEDNTFSDTKVVLMRDLDFNEDSSYRDPTSVTYGDINGNEEVEDLKTELTTGKGFPVIGGIEEIGQYSNGGTYKIFNTKPFSGVIDGNNHEIKNLYINRDNSALFALLSDASVCDLSISGNITSGGRAASIAVYSAGDIKIVNCDNKANITGSGYNSIGGLIASIEDSKISSVDSEHKYKTIILNCNNYGEIIGSSDCGGILGYKNNSGSLNRELIKIKGCNNYGTVSGGGNSGGIVGGMYVKNGENIEITDCVNEGDITGNAGIVGYMQCSSGRVDYVKITNCKNTGNISGGSTNSGIVGYTYVPCDNYEITNCINEGDIYTSGGAGMIGSIGSSYTINNLKIDNCINTGSVTGESTTGGVRGGLLPNLYGVKNVIITNCKVEGNGEKTISGYVTGGIIAQVSQSMESIIIDNCNIENMNFDGGMVGGIIGNCSYSITNKIRITNCNVNNTSLKGFNIGGVVARLAGSSFGNIEIENCYFAGAINQQYSESAYSQRGVGGIIGACETTASQAFVKNCSSEAIITGSELSGDSYIGGIIGYVACSGFNVENCINKGKVSTPDTGYREQYIGGIIGESSQDVNVKNCINYANINCNAYSAVGGILGAHYGSSSLIENCYNYGNLTSLPSYSSNHSIGGIVGYGSGTDVKKCFNKGNIITNKISSSGAGGIAGTGNNIEECYNSGNIDAQNSNYVGGILGAASSSVVKNCYNEGKVYGNHQIAGIIGGASGSTVNSYNIGNVKSYSYTSDSYSPRVGAIQPYASIYDSAATGYYLDTIKLTGNILDKGGVEKTWDEMISDEFYNTLNADGVWVKRDNLAPTLNFKMPVLEKGKVTELNVTNNRKEYKITATAVNGSVTDGYDQTVYAGGTNSIIKAYSNVDNELEKVVVNGEKIELDTTSDEEYIYATIPEGYFENIDQNLNVVFIFKAIEKIKTFTINKVDEETNEKLQGAEFDITSVRKAGVNQIGSSAGPNNYAIMGTDRYSFASTAVDEGYTWTSNNNNFGHNLTANSYATVDLRELTGTYVIDMDVSISSEEGKDIGYAVLSTETGSFTYAQAKDHEGKIFEISGEVNNSTYSLEVEGGARYYVAFGYAKDAEGISGSDTMTINSVTAKEKDTENYVNAPISQGGQYYFAYTNGKYVSTNNKKGVEGAAWNAITGSTAQSMMVLTIPDDGTEYELEVDVSVSNEEGVDYGFLRYADSSENLPYATAKDSDDLIFALTGKVDHAIYRIPVRTGSASTFLKFGYYNGADENGDVGTDSMTINSVKLIHKEGTYTTDENGVIATNLEADATYIVTETKAPEGYVLNPEPHIYVFTEDTNVTITNSEYPKVTTHHYLKENGEYTTKKVAEDVVIHGNIGDKYDTEVLKLEGLDLEKDELGEYVVPDNSYGTFGNSDIVVTYYYEAEPIELTIHHYTEGTYEKLAEDEFVNADAEVTFDDEGKYEVSVAQTYELSTNSNYRTLTRGAYTLSNVRSTVQDNLNIDDTLEYHTDTVLTYTYEDKEYTIATKVQRHEEVGQDDEENEIRTLVEGGTISGQGQAAYEVVDPGEDATKDIVISANDGYVINKITVTSIAEDGTETSKVLYGEGAESCEITYEGNEKTGVLSKFQNMQENKLVTVEFKLQSSQVIVHHIKVGSNEDYQTQTMSGNVGDEYRTNPITITGYELVRNTLNTSGLIAEEPIHVYYFYDGVECTIVLKYVDINSNEELDSEDRYGKFGTELNLTECAKDIAGYVLREVPEEETATYGLQAQTFIFKYAKEASVRAIYVEEGTTEPKLAEDVVIEGYEGKAYTTSAKNIEKYVLVATPLNATGTMSVTNTSSETLVVYEYVKKPTKVVVKYVDVNSNELVDSTEIPGKVDDPYEVTPSVPDGYVLMTEDSEGNSLLPTNTSGPMTEETIEVTYYVAKEASVRAIYVEEGTTEPKLAEDYVEQGYEGKAYTTSAKTIANYTLKATPTNATGTMSVTDESSETLVVYEYIKNSANVIERYVDINTEEVVDSINHPGHVGDQYEITPHAPEGYMIIEEDSEGNSLLPTNTNGPMTEETIIVEYKVARIMQVRAIYVKEGTETKVAEDVVIEGYEGKAYTTSAKTVADYELVGMPTNATGTMRYVDGKTEILVKYEYRGLQPVDNSTKVIEKYEDINTNEVVESIDHPGEVGDQYEITPHIPEGYVLIEEDKDGNSLLPTNTSGPMTEEIIEVVFKVAKKAKVIVKYVDETGEKLEEDVEIPGYEGKAYKTEEKVINGYRLVEIIGEPEGDMQAGDQVVSYKYEKIDEPVETAYVRVIYIDTDTQEKISEDTIIEGYDGKPYETTAKEITDYEILLIPTNAKGTMKITVDGEGNTINETLVKYIYKKNKATKVVEKYVDVNTKEVVESKDHPGKVGDSYEITPTVPKGYVLIEKDKDGKDILPENPKGRMTEETIEVVYYVAKDAKVKAKYVVKYEGKDIADEVEIPGYEGKEYSVDAKDIDGYELIEVDGKPEGTMKAGENVVTFYYAKKATGIIPQTGINGINIFLYAMFAIVVIAGVNGTVFVIYKFKK